jgi:ABC-2 type transport system permease protein
MRALLTYHSTLSRVVATRARLLGFAAVGLIGVVVAWRVGASHPPSPIGAAVGFGNAFGLNVIAPLSALVFGAAALGDTVEDGTLVYLWARPQPRWKLTLGAFTATLVHALPLAVVPTTLGAALLTSDGEVVASVAVATVVAVCVYAAAFVLVGLCTDRALVWGVAYVLIVETFIARGGDALAFLSIHAHAASILATMTGREVDLGEFAARTSVTWSIVVSALCLLITIRRLRRGDVA